MTESEQFGRRRLAPERALRRSRSRGGDLMTGLLISMNARSVEGPYGGGNQFANSLEDYLRGRGHRVFRQLVPNLDLILLVSCKHHHRTTAYDVDSIRDYITLNPNTLVVHRVNSCDEPRGQDLGINRAMLQANILADSTVFISSFVRALFAAQGIDLQKPNTVILNGADEKLFQPEGRAAWRPGQKMRIVTHHWSSNYLKGFDIYERLDQLLAIEPFKGYFEFTYIGNTPLGVTFRNAKVIEATRGVALADTLRKHHLYLTAARHESAGMHHIEGMRCGLPVLYLDSGALPEYCGPYGIEFTLVDFERKLLEMRERYGELRDRVRSCSYTGTWMAEQYERLFLALARDRRANPRPRPSLGERVSVRLWSRPGRKLKKMQELTTRLLRHLS